MAMLEVKDLQVSYGMIQAIKGISFEVNQGEVIALIGANGAGKTTILHTVTAIGLQNVPALHAHGLRHGEDRAIALACSDGSKADSCIS